MNRLHRPRSLRAHVFKLALVTSLVAGPGGCTTSKAAPAGGPGDAASSDAPASDAGGGASDAADRDGEVGAPDGGAMDAAGLDAASNRGFVTLTSNQAPARARATVTFLRGGPAFLCDEQAFGACTLYDCRARPGAHQRPASNAGTLSITGTTPPLTFAPGADGTYAERVLPAGLWTGGEMLTASAAGAQVPAFEGTLVPPRAITWLTPAVPNGDWMLDRSHDIELTWSGATEAEVKVVFGSNLTEDPLELECTFWAGDARGIVPSAGLSMIPAGDGYFGGSIRSSRDLEVGDWRVTLRADSDAVLLDGRLAQGSAVFQ